VTRSTTPGSAIKSIKNATSATTPQISDDQGNTGLALATPGAGGGRSSSNDKRGSILAIVTTVPVVTIGVATRFGQRLRATACAVVGDDLHLMGLIYTIRQCGRYECRPEVRAPPIVVGSFAMASPVAEQSDSDAPVTNAAPPSASSSSVQVELCAHCGAPRRDITLAWCRNCGFHSGLGYCIELDELDRHPELADAVEPELSLLGHLHRFFRYLGESVGSMPPWLWKTAAGVIAIALVSMLGRVLTPQHSPQRSAWALAQLGVGLVAMLVTHVGCYLQAVVFTDKLSPADMLLRPLEIWKPTLQRIGESGVWWRPAIWVWGFASQTFAVAVVGNVPFDRLWDMGPAERAKKELVEAMEERDSPRKESDDENAGFGAAGEAAAQKRDTLDCLVLGYIPAENNQSDFTALVLAASIDGNLRTIGRVSRDIGLLDRQMLKLRFPKLIAGEPYIPCNDSAVWLKPVLACRVSFTSWADGRRPINLRFVKMLADLDPQ
jgi:hypothetical protein